jgi:hypothetical protein
MQAKKTNGTPNTPAALLAAFNEWQTGLVYVCKKTGNYRYRRGLALAPWSADARKQFTSKSEFERAAAAACPKVDGAKAKQPAAPVRPSNTSERANVIDLAKARKSVERATKPAAAKTVKATRKSVRK